MKYRCAHCGKTNDGWAGHVNRARARGLKLYCDRKCSGRLPEDIDPWVKDNVVSVLFADGTSPISWHRDLFGTDEGVSVDFLNPLLKTMKRLSENVITYKPAVRT